ncbi:MAG: hypothetical protein PUC00_08535, partial [Clostridiales bacterium]|nr:hypothetical protein [Clostridiales bacterium]
PQLTLTQLVHNTEQENNSYLNKTPSAVMRSSIHLVSNENTSAIIHFTPCQHIPASGIMASADTSLTSTVRSSDHEQYQISLLV